MRFLLFLILCNIFAHSRESKPSRKLKLHPCVPGTSERATDQDSRHEAPDLVMPGSRFTRVGKKNVSHGFSCYIRFTWSPFCGFAMRCTSLPVLDGAASSESQTGKQHLSFVNKGKMILRFASLCLHNVWLQWWDISVTTLSQSFIFWFLVIFIHCLFVYFPFLFFNAVNKCLIVWAPESPLLSVGGRGETESGDVEGRRIVRYPDSHQLFVGNLPHDIDESELKDFFMSTFASEPTPPRPPPPPTGLECHRPLIRLCLFSAYGSVVELRINTKGVGGKLPNFGFVVFDDSDPVQRILGAKVEGARIDVSSHTLACFCESLTRISTHEPINCTQLFVCNSPCSILAFFTCCVSATNQVCLTVSEKSEFVSHSYCKQIQPWIFLLVTWQQM